jgi:hypothetical protein
MGAVFPKGPRVLEAKPENPKRERQMSEKLRTPRDLFHKLGAALTKQAAQELAERQFAHAA